MNQRCQTCNSHFNQEERIPKEMQCGHYFCLKCCLENQVHFDFFLCPLDFIMFSGSVTQLKNNENIQQEIIKYSQGLQQSKDLQRNFQIISDRVKMSFQQEILQIFQKLKAQAVQEIKDRQTYLINQQWSSQQLIVQKTIQNMEILIAQIDNKNGYYKQLENFSYRKQTNQNKQQFSDI